MWLVIHLFSFISKCFPGFPFNSSKTKEIKCKSCFFLFRFEWTEERITLHVLNILVTYQRCVKFTLDDCAHNTVFITLLSFVCLFFIFHPQHLKLSMHILHTVLYTFPRVLTKRIWLTNQSLVDDHFLYSCDLHLDTCV